MSEQFCSLCPLRLAVVLLSVGRPRYFSSISFSATKLCLVAQWSRLQVLSDVGVSPICVDKAADGTGIQTCNFMFSVWWSAKEEKQHAVYTQNNKKAYFMLLHFFNTAKPKLLAHHNYRSVRNLTPDLFPYGLPQNLFCHTVLWPYILKQRPKATQRIGGLYLFLLIPCLFSLFFCLPLWKHQHISAMRVTIQISCISCCQGGIFCIVFLAVFKNDNTFIHRYCIKIWWCICLILFFFLPFIFIIIFIFLSFE